MRYFTLLDRLLSLALFCYFVTRVSNAVEKLCDRAIATSMENKISGRVTFPGITACLTLSGDANSDVREFPNASDNILVGLKYPTVANNRYSSERLWSCITPKE